MNDVETSEYSLFMKMLICTKSGLVPSGDWEKKSKDEEEKDLSEVLFHL
jgi:hypothetical protein